jgi:N-acetylglucosamine kinase-like BadF-type ATPase
MHRVGGYGYLLGDAGSGFSLGSKAILAALSFEDGSGDETLLYDAVRRKCATPKVIESLNKFYSGGKREIAQYAPLVLDAYDSGDRISERILFDELERVASAVRGASKHLPNAKEPIKVVLCGGLCPKGGVIHRILSEILAKENYSVSVCDRPLVLHGGSGTPNDQMQNAIHHGITKINIYSDVVAAMNKGLKDKLNTMENPATWPFLVFADARSMMKEVARNKLRIFGSAGRL